jgi:hypothetical protein
MLWGRAGAHIENRRLGSSISAYNSWAMPFIQPGCGAGGIILLRFGLWEN